MDIAGIVKSYQTYSQKTGKEWKLSDSLWEQIAEYASEGVAQNVYMNYSQVSRHKKV